MPIHRYYMNNQKSKTFFKIPSFHWVRVLLTFIFLVFMNFESHYQILAKNQGIIKVIAYIYSIYFNLFMHINIFVALNNSQPSYKRLHSTYLTDSAVFCFWNCKENNLFNDNGKIPACYWRRWLMWVNRKWRFGPALYIFMD